MTKFYNISFNTDGFMSKQKLSKECIQEMIYIHLYVHIYLFFVLVFDQQKILIIIICN